MDGVEIAECTVHLKQRLQTAAKIPEAERPTPTLQSENTSTPGEGAGSLEKRTATMASKLPYLSEQSSADPASNSMRAPLLTTAPVDASKPCRRQSRHQPCPVTMPIHLYAQLKLFTLTILLIIPRNGLAKRTIQVNKISNFYMHVMANGPPKLGP